MIEWSCLVLNNTLANTGEQRLFWDFMESTCVRHTFFRKGGLSREMPSASLVKLERKRALWQQRPRKGVGCSRSKPKLIDLLIAFQLLYKNVAARKQGYVCYTTQVFEMHIAATTNVESFVTLCFFLWTITVYSGQSFCFETWTNLHVYGSVDIHRLDDQWILNQCCGAIKKCSLGTWNSRK